VTAFFNDLYWAVKDKTSEFLGTVASSFSGSAPPHWCTHIFNIIFRFNKMPDEWRRSILIPIFKNKGDIQSCTNYRGIKLMSHTMKLWERVIEHRLRKLRTISKNQFGFMPGRSTMEAIFLIR
jgi:Reverse transcriptase (RNA-dependent DNA polymerase)